MDIGKKYIEERIDDLEREVARLRLENSSLRKDLDSQKKILSALNEQLKKFLQGDEKFSPSPPPPKVVLLSKAAQSPKVAPTPPSSPDENFIIRQFNRLSELSGNAFIAARIKFCRENQVVGLSCENIMARMSNPNTPLTFAEMPPVDGDFWLIRIAEKKFAALPNPKNGYNDNLHMERAFGEVFESNFVEGENYDKIKVINPATFEKFNDSWRILSKGRLSLE